MITQKVLVSPKFRMDSAILNQIGEHRNQLKIRHDHWVPFCIVSGLTDSSLVKDIIAKCVSINRGPLPYYRLPLRPDKTTQFPGWVIPEQLKQKTWSLCDTLESEFFAQRFNQGNELTLYWERDEYRFLVEEVQRTWPEFVRHESLKLLRNRYPVVPGFDNKTRSDLYQELSPEPAPPTSFKDFLKKPTTWKVKNKIPETGQVHRYASKFGKKYPILKKTALTSKYRKE